MRWFIIAKDLLVNEKIGNKKVRVVNSSGPMGIMSSLDALQLARQEGLDLVEISPNADPPVCKIIDYGKFCFEKKKKEKEAKKNQKISELKKIRLSVKIDSGDFNTKLEHAKKFISNGDKVEISIRFKGRESQHPELGMGVLSDFCDRCYDFAEIIKRPMLEGRNAVSVISPLSSKIKELRKKKALEKADSTVSPLSSDESEVDGSSENSINNQLRT